MVAKAWQILTIGNNDSAEKRSTEIGNSAFSECTSLSSVTIGNNVTSGSSSI